MPSHDDPGLARERTGLAWERSALTFAALAAVVLGVAAHHDAPALLALSAALVAAGAAVWRHGRRSYEREGAPPQVRALALMALAVAATALVDRGRRIRDPHRPGDAAVGRDGHGHIEQVRSEQLRVPDTGRDAPRKRRAPQVS